MSLESLSLLPELRRLPVSEGRPSVPLQEIRQRLIEMDRDHWSIEASAGVEKTLLGIFDARNVADDLQEAYHASFTRSNLSLFEHYTDILERGDAAVTKFINPLKGKVAEMRVIPDLEQHYPDATFSIAQNPTERIYDLKGSWPDGREILVQVKMGGETYASEVVERIQDAPANVPFAVSRELYERIAETHPELLPRVINTGISNFQLTEGIKSDLEILAQNHGIDIPDSIGEILPYVGEIVLGVKLIVDMVSVERDFRDADISDRTRVHALKALTLMSRFGISTVCIGLGGAAGSVALPGAGTAAGHVSGAGLALFLNSRLKPRMLEIAMEVVAMSVDDMFYLRNKVEIDCIGASLAATSVPQISRQDAA